MGNIRFRAKIIYPIWEDVKKKIRLRLVNKEGNTEYLKERVYKEYLDFAAVFMVRAAEFKTGRALIPVTKKMLMEWEVTIDGLWEAALENLEEEECIIEDIGAVLPGDIRGRGEDAKIYMCMTLNSSGGAEAILKRGLLKEFAGEYKEQVYILPRSVRETMLVLYDGKDAGEILRGMMLEINERRKKYAPEEWLSDSVYYYDRERDEVRIAT